MVTTLMRVSLFILILSCLGLRIEGAEQPNIVVFLVDDMGVGYTSVPFLYENGKPKRIRFNTN